MKSNIAGREREGETERLEARPSSWVKKKILEKSHKLCHMLLFEQKYCACGVSLIKIYVFALPSLHFPRKNKVILRGAFKSIIIFC